MLRHSLVSLVVLSLLLTSGCSFVSFEKRFYKRDIDPVVKDELSFASKEALAAGATLQNQTAAEIYYKGTKPESKQAKILYEMSYRFMHLAGVNNNFDPTDPESVEKVFKEADNALREKDKTIHNLEVRVKQQLEEMAARDKLVRDKVAELEDVEGKWRAKLGKIWYWIYTVAISIVVVIVGLGILQAWTGIPLLTGLFGGIRLIFGAAKQTIKGVQTVRDELKHTIQNGGTEEEKAHAKKVLEKIDKALAESQDESVKNWIRKQKEKMS